MKKILILLISLISFNGMAQLGLILPKTKHIIIGVKAGVPNTLTGNLEIVPPILKNHLGIYADLTKINLSQKGAKLGVNYLEFGGNLYLRPKGKGPYISVGKSNLNIDFEINDITIEDMGVSFPASAKVSQKLSSTNFKLGYRTGGLFYIRIEAGFGLGEIPKTIQVNAIANSPTGILTESKIVDIPKIPGTTNGGFIVGNIGFGFAF